MTRLPDDVYLQHLRDESARFRDVLAGTDPANRVPSCPDWDAADLLWHLTEVQHFWSRIVTERPTAPDDFEEPSRPTTYADLLAAFDAASAGLVSALEAADPEEQAWTWAPEQTVGFTFRRQAHEALIHRLDAEQAAGEVTGLDARLAADGVEETLAVMFGGTPEWGSFAGNETYVRVDCIDTDHHVWVELGRFTGTDPDDDIAHDEDDINVVTDPGREPDVIVSGTAADLDAWLWRRAGADGVTVAGDRAAYDLFLACVNHPIN